MSSKSLIELIELPVITDDCKLSVAEERTLPFAIKRLYYIYDSDPNLPRGFHAHHKTAQILFCLKGSITMILDDGARKETVQLQKPSQGILLQPLVWHEMHNFTPDTILLVLASHEYDSADYIRDYQEFLQITQSKKGL